MDDTVTGGIQERVQVGLRLPAELAERVRRLAEQERRPLNTQYAIVIELGLSYVKGETA